MGPAYMTAAFGDAGACHPRDNIALRYLTDRLDLGYDLFDAIMTAREVQAERMALRCLKNGRNITIVGKAYKPAVPYTIGSATMLVGYYIEKHGGNLNYYDPNTGDLDLREDWTQVYLIGYWEDWVEKLEFSDPGCVVIDPWRKLTTKQHTGEIIHYGDTRPKKTYSVPESTIQTMRTQVYEMFPDLRQFDNEIHLVDATINMDTTFVLRPTEALVKELLEAKQQGRSKFLFFAPTEAFMPHVVSKVQRLASILDGQIDESDIIVVTGVIDADEIYDRLLKKNGWNKRLNLLNCHFFNYITTTYARGYEYIGGYDVRFRGKIFTCFNKLNREHRLVLLERMLQTRLIQNGYYSFEGEGNFKDSIPSLSDEKFPAIKHNQDMFPIRLNITPDRHNPVDIQPDDLHYYKDSYFSIVSETLFYNKDRVGQAHRPFVEDSLFLTEKTYRCFATLHPFILMARPHSLKELRKQGFKTFAPFINEAYDDIEDDDQRFEAIFREITRLNNFTGDDWTLFQEGIKSIVEYNKDYFHKNKDFAITKDYLKFFGEVKPKYTSAPVVMEKLIQPVETVTQMPNVVPEYMQPAPPSNDIPTMEDISEKLDWRNRQVVYSNGITLNFPCHVDGGGDSYRDELVALIERTGQKTNYESALDWCAGHGPFGFELLDSNIADHVTFMDCYAPAVESCINNGQENNISDRVTGYTCDKISLIPESEKFDLVVANPPHSNTLVNIERNEFFANTARMIVDDNFVMHREFFENIRKYLTDDADVYITAGNDLAPFANWAYAGNLKFMGFSPCSGAQGGIYHFRKISPN